MDLLKMFSGMMSGGAPAAPKAQQVTSPVEAQSAPTAATTNDDHNPAAVAMSKAQPEVSNINPPPAEAVAQKPDEKQSLLMKAVESLAKTFGVDLGQLTKLLMKANPKVAQEAITNAMQAVVAKQAPAVAANPA